MEDLIVEYRWTRSEFYRAVRKSARVTYLEGLFILVAAALSIFFHIVIFSVLFCIVLWALLSYVLRPLLWWKKVPGMKELRQVSFSDKGITTATTSRITAVAWSRFDRSRETSDYYLIIRDKSSVAIPFRKSIFVNSVDEARFRSLLRIHTNTSLRPNAELDKLVSEP